MTAPWRASEFFIALTISVAIFTDMFLYSVVIPVLPFALSELARVPEKDVQFWTTAILTAYTSTFLVGSVISGWVTDRLSKRSSLLVIGLFLMLGATVMLFLSRSITLLIVSRMIQGATGAMVWSAGLALLLDTFGHERFGRVMGYVIICQTLGTAIGPTVGGVVFAAAGYNAVLYICFVLVGIDILLRLLMVDKPVSRDGQSRKQNRENSSHGARTREGLVNPSEATPLLLHNRDAAPENFWASWYAFVIMVTTPHVLAILTCFANIWAFQTAFDAVLPYRVKYLFGWGSAGSGLIFLPLILPAYLAPASDLLSTRWGVRRVTAAFYLLGIPSFSCLAIIQHNDTLDRVLLCVFLFLSGLVINLSISPLTSDLTYAIEQLEAKHSEAFGGGGAYGRAFGLLNCAFAVGGVIGPSLGGFLVAKAGWTALCSGMGAINLVNLVLVVS
ncbi:major facilitator superfamily domain-containing protein [Bisporella sp. PMI_857]|nr:major facilitator superfamily domain-containing protein [Bisporella sp. PMI_857]